MTAAGDPVLAAMRRLVEPYGLRCDRVTGERPIRVYARSPGRQGYFISHNFRFEMRLLTRVKAWLGAPATQRKLAALQAARNEVAG